MNDMEDKITAQIKIVTQSLVKMKQDNNSKYDFASLISNVQEIDDSPEPTVLFLGTVSMKPTMYRSASAIIIFIKGHGLLMDCAEGSYGQLLDHFQSIERVNQALLKLRVAFITHIHGDHQLGIFKIMVERDKLLDGIDPSNKLYIVTPTIMMEYMIEIRDLSCKYP